MKNAVMIFTGTLLGIITMVIIMTILGRMNRSVELQSNLSAVVENGVQQMKSITSDLGLNEIIETCIRELAVSLDTDSKVQVDVMGGDVEKGVLSIRVTEQFKHPNGTAGSTKWERTAIWNQLESTPELSYEVRFYRTKTDLEQRKNCYKTYRVQEGDKVVPPKNPSLEEGTFVCWKDPNDYIADFSQPIKQNLIYYAQWK